MTMVDFILYADDKILDANFRDSNENSLYENLAAETLTIGVNRIDSLRSLMNRITSCNAIILDWDFGVDKEDEADFKGVEMPQGADNNPLELLNDLEFFAPIFIYSSNVKEVETNHGDTLKEKFGDRIKFRDKANLGNVEEECELILREIDDWLKKTPTLSIPSKWSSSINQSVQKIFTELSKADQNWIRELWNTAKIDGVPESIEVINLFQNILNERIIQDHELIKVLDEFCEGESPNEIDAEHLAQLFRVMLYGAVRETDPIMTGDIFRLSDKDYCVLLTPECDIRKVTTCKSQFDCLVFSCEDFSAKKSDILPRIEFKNSELYNNVDVLTKAQKERIGQNSNEIKKALTIRAAIQAFTQTPNARFHILPCFEFEKDKYDGIAAIDFSQALVTIGVEEIYNSDRIGKLNTPYIQELRQRFYAYKGRIGVPGYSQKLREWLVDQN